MELNPPLPFCGAAMELAVKEEEEVDTFATVWKADYLFYHAGIAPPPFCPARAEPAHPLLPPCAKPLPLPSGLPDFEYCLVYYQRAALPVSVTSSCC